MITLSPGCGIGGYHFAIYKTQFPYSGKFTNSIGLNLAYRIRFPYKEFSDSSKMPLLLYIDGSGPFPLSMHSDRLLSHFQSRGFVSAIKQKRGVAPSEGDFSKLTFEERIQDNLDFIKYLLQQYPEIDPSQIYIMGYSEGANIAGTVAYRYRNPAGLIWVSACFDEDWFDVIVSQHSEDEKEMIERIRSGQDTDGKWQYYSKQWWYQHFNHSHLPELMNLSCPIIFLMGDKDPEFPPLQERFREMLAKGKEDISLYIITSVGHGTSAPINQESLLSTIDLWLEDISREKRR
jgi:dienelactone hydrolase